MRKALQNGLLLLASLVFTILAGEIVVRLFIPVRNVGPTFSSYDPYYGKVLKRNFTCTRSAPEFTMTFSTNSYGHRGPEPAAFPAHPILFLGDSFTSGYGVNDGEEFPDLIRSALERRNPAGPIPVVNAGSGNTGNGYWLRFLKAEGSRYQPRLVVFGFCVNDFSDNIADGMYSLSPEGRLQEDTTVHLQHGARTAQQIIEAIPGLAYSHLVGLARQAYSERMPADAITIGTNQADGAGSDDELTYRLVGAALDLCNTNRWPAVLVAIETSGARLERLRALCAAYNVRLLVPPAKSDRPDLYYVVDGHWNAAGHRVMGDMLMQLLDSDALLTQ